MKRVIASILMILVCLPILAGCGASEKDWDYIAKKGTLKIGYTLYEPMNFKDEETDELTGFDTEFAKLVCAELGLTPEFVLIDWDAKVIDLDAKSIDCIWNGFTVDDKRKEQVDFSTSYLINKQVAIIKKSNADVYKTLEDMKDASFAAEQKSAGETAFKTNDIIKNNTYNGMDYQSSVILEINSGTSDVGIIDYIMAKATVGEGTANEDIIIVEGVELAPEEYAIGFRKGSPVTLEKVNAAIQKLADNGKLAALAEKYSLTDELADGLK